MMAPWGRNAVPNQDPNQDDVQAFAAELYAVAAAAAAKHGRNFKPIAAGELRQLVQAAAAEVFSPTQFGSRSVSAASHSLDERKEQARAATRLLVDKMTDHAITIPSYQRNLLGQQTLTHAKSVLSGFCPCWPFC